MRAASGRRDWVAAMAILTVTGWGFLYSPWFQWAPAGARWPSLLIAPLFGLTAFLTLIYYPLLLTVVFVSMALEAPRKTEPIRRPVYKSPLFQTGTAFLLGFLSVHNLQQMALLFPALKHSQEGRFPLESALGGYFVLAALGALFYTARGKLIFGGTTAGRLARMGVVFSLGLGWGAYYGHDFDRAYDRVFFWLGSGQGSHEAFALMLFSAGIVGLHFLVSWGSGLWLGSALEGRGVRIGSCVAAAFWGFLILVGFHPF